MQLSITARNYHLGAWADQIVTLQLEPPTHAPIFPRPRHNQTHILCSPPSAPYISHTFPALMYRGPNLISQLMSCLWYCRFIFLGVKDIFKTITNAISSAWKRATFSDSKKVGQHALVQVKGLAHYGGFNGSKFALKFAQRPSSNDRSFYFLFPTLN